jgi:hypothetical protein
MNSIQATYNQIAVSANVRESAINTEGTLDTLMLFDMANAIQLEPRREDNSNETIGKEEADSIYDNGALSSYSASNEKAQPQHFAFLFGFGLGSVSSAALGDGYKHTITPISGDFDADRSNPSFTAAQRFGKTITKRRFASMFVDSVTATFAKDSWAKIAAAIKGTGKYSVDYVEETISALDNVTSLTLAANGVAGSTAAERLANVHQIKVELAAGVWTEVAYSAVSAATPAIITITSAGGAGTSKDYKVLYRPTEAAWATFPARVTESPLRVSELTVNIGGTWSGSAFTGGRALTSEISSLEYTLNNNGNCQFVPGSGGAHAGRFRRSGRTQKIKVDREFRELIMQNKIAKNETFGIYIKCEGALYDATYKYQVEFIFPKCAVLAAPIGVDDKRLSESMDVQVLEHDTYGSVIVIVQNLVEKYAAAS